MIEAYRRAWRPLASRCDLCGCVCCLRRLLLGRSLPWPGFAPGLGPCYETLYCAAGSPLPTRRRNRLVLGSHTGNTQLLSSYLPSSKGSHLSMYPLSSWLLKLEFVKRGPTRRLFFLDGESLILAVVLDKCAGYRGFLGD